MPSNIIKFLPVIFVFLWSTGFIGAKLGLPYIESASFLVVRFALVLAILAVFIASFKVRFLTSRRAVFDAMVSGLFMQGVYLFGVFSAIQNGLSAGLTALIVAMQPILTALIVRRLFKEHLAPRQWFGIAIAFIGVAMVLSHKITGFDVEESLSFVGLGFAIMALLGITIGTIYQKSHKSQMDLSAVNFWQNSGAMILVLIFALIYERQEIYWSGELIFALGWLVIILSILAYYLLFMLIKANSVNKTASLFFLVPGVTAVWGWLLFGETLGWFEIAAIVIASYGVLLARAEVVTNNVVTDDVTKEIE